MRGVISGLFLLILNGASNAQTVPCPAGFPPEIPCKKIRIFNNSAAPLYVIIESGNRPVDEWLQAQFNVQPNEPSRTYESKQVIRVYVNGDKGIAANGSAEVTLPFYTRLSDSTDGKTANQFIDWWNGGRIYLYDDAQQIQKNYKNDSAKIINNPKTPGPCVGPVNSSCTSQLAIYYRPVCDGCATGLPPTDHNQLLEFTFADAITAKGKPYSINLNGVGYNISSVDQVYLPVAMEALTINPPGQVQYIGTVMPLGTVNDPPTANTFRRKLKKFLDDFPGWPQYNSAINKPNPPTPPDPNRPRVPGAYNVFANGFTNPYNDVLTTPGAAITSMINQFKTCKTSTAGICDPYSQVIELFQKNLDDYKKLTCAKPVTDEQTEMLKRIYGWVPFNDNCGEKSNDLLATTQALCKSGKNAFCGFNKFQDEVYTRALQYSKWDGGVSFSFNPYVKLIHDLNYLHMAAYAYSVDDAIGFQSYPGIGLIIAYAGDNGLDNKTPLDRTKRVVVTLGVKHQGVPEWASVGFCSNDTSKNVDPLFASVTFYPGAYPCTFTAKDLKGAKYQFVIQSAPPNLAVDIPPSCNPLPQIPPWICFVTVATIDGEKNYINTGTIIPAPPPPTFNFPSTHDFNADGKSDILWRNANGSLAMWMMNGGVVASTGVLTPSKDSTWSIVGQRDFDRDGKADLLWLRTNGDLERWFLNGTGTGPSVISTQSFGNVGTAWRVVGTGDFNGDGFGDTLWQDTSGNVAVWLMNDTTSLVASKVIGTVPAPWTVAAVAHFNTDTSIPRNSDILWRNTATGALAIWFMNGISLVSAANVATVPTSWTVVGTGDFNGDGFDDILWRDTSGNTAIWLMKGALVLQSGGLGVVPTSWSAVLTGDYNFDGKSDILWRDSSGNSAIWFMNGTQVASSAGLGSVPTTWTVQSANAE